MNDEPTGDLDDTLTPDEAAKADREGRKGIAPAFRTVGDWEWLDDGHDTPPARALLRDESGDVFCPRDKVGMVAAPGGTGKTTALLQLAVAVATGRDWLGTYPVDEPGHVVCALAETTRHDLDRMLNTVADDLKLTPEDRQNVRNRLYALPLAGRTVGLMDDPSRRLRLEQQLFHDAAQRQASRYLDEDGNIQLDRLYRTDACETWRNQLAAHAPEDGWRLIILDPASRFIGPDVESDNAAATRFIELLEEWKGDPEIAGNGSAGPTVLISHHVNKRSNDDPIEMLYRQGAARGSSALTDGVRWQLNMNSGHVEQGGELAEYVVMRAAKANAGPGGGVTWLTRTNSRTLRQVSRPSGELMGPADVAEWHSDSGESDEHGNNNVTSDAESGGKLPGQNWSEK